jgi:hypothetical protein
MAEEQAKKPTVTGVTTIPNKDSEFFRAWLEVMRPLHGLASKEMDFAAAFLKKRYELAKTMTDDRLIDRVLFDAETKNAVAESLGISYSYMQYIFKKMRECGMIREKRINPQFLPAYEGGKQVRWMFIFKNNVD